MAFSFPRWCLWGWERWFLALRHGHDSNHFTIHQKVVFVCVFYCLFLLKKNVSGLNLWNLEDDTKIWHATRLQTSFGYDLLGYTTWRKLTKYAVIVVQFQQTGTLDHFKLWEASPNLEKHYIVGTIPKLLILWHESSLAWGREFLPNRQNIR